VVAGPEAGEGRARALRDLGCEILCAPDAAGALAALAGRGITRALVEGGAAVAASLLRGGGLVDRLYLFEAPLLLGAEALPSVGRLGVGRLADAPRWRRADGGEDRRLGDDRLRVLDAAG
jgi:diaminohydroxyphosphoribosylaminopyrimidine deaminase / 5-amino-6-(5-phosphoribosylamino)uracil reductase